MGATSSPGGRAPAGPLDGERRPVAQSVGRFEEGPAVGEGRRSARRRTDPRRRPRRGGPRPRRPMPGARRATAQSAPSGSANGRVPSAVPSSVTVVRSSGRRRPPSLAAAAVRCRRSRAVDSRIEELDHVVDRDRLRRVTGNRERLGAGAAGGRAVGRQEDQRAEIVRPGSARRASCRTLALPSALQSTSGRRRPGRVVEKAPQSSNSQSRPAASRARKSTPTPRSP